MLHLPGLSDLPVLGPALFRQSPVVLLSLAAVAGVWFFLMRTRSGLLVRAVGESPAAAASRGFAVRRVQILCCLAGGALAGCAGGFYSLSVKPGWGHPQGCEGAGWIALAIVIFGGWKPTRVALGALFFAAIQVAGIALQDVLPGLSGTLFQIAPFPVMRNNILREDLDAVIEHLKQDDPILTHGSNVRAFEAEWSKWLGVKYSVFVNSGASANLLTMAVLKLRHPEGGEVIVPPLTWVSDVASVLQNGFTPVFADIDPTTLAMAPGEILKKITDKTRAVFLTHVQGFDGLTDELISELEQRGIPLIEDVCESHGATHAGRRLGSIGLVSNFSFYYAHHMSTIEGGMVCTNDPEIYQQIRMLRSHGMVRESSDNELKARYQAENPELNPDFIFAFPAFNTRNTEIGGILGRSQLKRLDSIVQRRTENLLRFFDKIDARRYRTDFKLEGSSNYAFNLILKNADDTFVQRLMLTMRESGIEFRRGSAGGGNQLRQPYLKGIVPAGHHLDFPQTEHIHFYGFYIGNFPDLHGEEVDALCAILNAV